MDVTGIPFNRFLGLRAGEASLTLPSGPDYLNHLGTVHAAAQYALDVGLETARQVPRMSSARPTRILLSTGVRIVP